MSALRDEARQLIDAALADELAPDGAQARIWDQLRTQLDAPLSPTASAALESLGSSAAGTSLGAAGTSLGTAGLGKLLIGGALACALSASAWLTFHAPARNAGAPAAPASVGAPQAARDAARETPVAPPLTAPPPTAAVREREQAPTAVPAARAKPQLSAETRLVAGAQRALRDGAPQRALQLLAQHRARFPRGTLAAERDAANVLALCALDRDTDAARARARFLTRWPSSPLAERVRARCRTSVAAE